MKNIIATIFLITAAVASSAQPPVPAPAQSKPIALTGGTAHIGNGQVIQNAIITFDKGKITQVADASSTQVDLSGFEEIKVNGKHIYPGFILPNSRTGLDEVGSIRAMQDYNEEGEFNPNVRALISYNTDSEFIPTFRFNGVLLAEATPSGGRIPGSSSVMELDGWNWEDAAHTKDVGIHLNWPQMFRRQFDFSTFTVSVTENKDYPKEVEELSTFVAEAAAYGKLPSKTQNLKFDAMQGLFDGTGILFIHADNPKEIVESIKFAQRNGVKKITLITGEDSRFVSEFLSDNKIPVILPATHNLPDRVDDDVDLMFKLPVILTKAGVSVSIYNDKMMHNGRNLGFFAGSTVEYGLDKEEALKLITSNTAKALGIDGRVGTLEKGKDATLFVSEGDALDYKTNKLTHAFISGKLVTLPNKQEELYQRFSRKYGQMK